ncbi:MAG: hypothetical protein EP347_04345 [Alphaproteobacteria bacterium]|nr:MAG: hypothetical protein EP347_04345 [Alphaproteobacteria bacterium]
MPSSRPVRLSLGGFFVLFGTFGFLPVVGFWMIPVGMLILSYDIPWVRRKRRQIEVWWGRRQQKRAEARGQGGADPETTEITQ